MSILGEIMGHKVQEVARRKRERSWSSVESEAGEYAPRPFGQVLARGDGPPRIIAEHKRASPSAGTIRADLDIEDVARAYADAGAAAMSVLTDERFFSGTLADLAAARRVVELPILRKDFVIDPYQVVEARAAGADAVLLIVAGLAAQQLDELFACVGELGLEALVEVHGEAEAERAADLGAKVIGVNHRDLATFEVDLSLTRRLRHRIPAEVVFVAESGIGGIEDMKRLARDGADAMLIGEYLMRAPEPGEALRELVTGVRS